jgi:hypothetical protein
MPKGYISEKKTLEHLDISPRGLKRLIRQGDGPRPVTIEGRTYFTADSVYQTQLQQQHMASIVGRP